MGEYHYVYVGRKKLMGVGVFLFFPLKRKNEMAKKILPRKSAGRAVRGKTRKRRRNKTGNQHAIVAFTIRELFGYLTYDLAVDTSELEKLGKLAILYGLNGTGKTTILRLAYHMLSAVPSMGHKSYLANIPFKMFGVTLLDGATVFAERAEATRGSYTLSVTRRNHGAVSHMFVAADDPPRIPGERAEGPSYNSVMEALGELASTFFYLADDRSLNIDYHEQSEARVPFDVGYFENSMRQSGRFREAGQDGGESIAVAVAGACIISFSLC
jgi:hypothetical protein